MEQMTKVAKIAGLYNEMRRLSAIVHRKNMILRRVVFDFSGDISREVVFESYEPLISSISDLASRRISEIETELAELLKTN